MKKEVMFVQNGKQLASKIKKILEKSGEQKIAIYLEDELTTFLRANQIWTPVICAGKYYIYLKYHKEFGFEEVTQVRVDMQEIYVRTNIGDENKSFLIMLAT